MLKTIKAKRIFTIGLFFKGNSKINKPKIIPKIEKDMNNDKIEQ